VRCSCGCERTIGLKELRANRRARAAGKLVGEMESLGFETDSDEYRRAFLSEGVSWRNQYIRVVHGELTREQIRSNAAWAAWRGGTRAALAEARRERRSP
jgi:hypothetical protein